MANFPGTSGQDNYQGTVETDTISGGGGNDWLSDSLDGSDLIDGGDGDDYLYLNRIHQTGGAVTILGGAGNDRITISTPTGGDLSLTVDAGAGDDYLSIWELQKTATITLGAGRDVVFIGTYQSIYLGAQTNITFTDFEAGANGDLIDWTWFLGLGQTFWNSWDRYSNPFSTGHLRLVQVGADVALQIDRNGGGDQFSSFMTFANASLAAFTHHNFGGWEPNGITSAPVVEQGSAGADEFRGGGGNDTLVGLGGHDLLFGGGGDDILDGGDDSDTLNGGFGDDLLLGGGGSDRFVGGFGNDVAYGGLGNDFFENIEGGSDAFYGEGGNDYFSMDFGFFTGVPQRYLVDGGSGDDTLVVDSYALDDHLNADMGDGADRVHFFIFRGLGIVTLGAGQDIVELSGATPYFPDSAVILTDFSAGAAGDTLTWLPVLDTVAENWDNATDPFATGYARLVQQGSATLLQIDKDGPNETVHGFQTILTLLGTSAAALTAYNIGLAPTVIVEAAAPVAANDSFLIVETGTISGNLLADNGAGADTVDAQGIALVGAVNGTAAALGQRFLLPSGAVVTVDVRGNFNYDPNGAFDHLAAWGTGGSNSQAQDSFTYTLAGGGTGTVTVTIRGAYSSPHEILGTPGSDVLTGTAEADIFSPGAGSDQMTGGAGDDIYNIDDFGDLAIEAAGEGTDEVRTALGSKTDHSQLYVLPANIENLTGTSVTGQGQGVRGNSLDNVIIMGGGSDLLVLDDGGNDSVTAGGGDDFIYYGAAWSAADSTDGGAGTDTVGLLGSYSVTLTATTLVGVERLALYTGGAGGTPNNYSITTHDATVAAGAELLVTAASLQATETLIFNGSAETNGRFSVLGGAGGDIVAGGAKADYLAGRAGDDQLYGLGGNDTLLGGLGADTLRGGTGRDIFRFENVNESNLAATDTILDFRAGGEADRIDLSAIDAKSGTAANDAFVFIGTNTAFTGAGGEVRVTHSNGQWFVEADVDGDMVADLLIRIDNGVGHVFTAGDFML